MDAVPLLHHRMEASTMNQLLLKLQTHIFPSFVGGTIPCTGNEHSILVL